MLRSHLHEHRNNALRHRNLPATPLRPPGRGLCEQCLEPPGPLHRPRTIKEKRNKLFSFFRTKRTKRGTKLIRNLYKRYSKNSIEVHSETLSKSLSHLTSNPSVPNITALWREPRERRSTLQVVAAWLPRRRRRARPDVVVLHPYCPERYKNAGTEVPHAVFSRRTERPKLCGPGEALQKLKESGRVRHVGVSNVNAQQLQRLTAAGRPACLQIEMHALCQQEDMIAAAAALNVPVVAYSPLGSKALADALAAKTGREYPDLLTLPAVRAAAAAHGRTPAQVLLRYALQRGVAVIPKSTNPQRILQNISLWDFSLSESEMASLRALDRGAAGRICDFSFFPGVEKHPEFPFNK
ncbi:hypothetical protein JYU34_018832 [Plutella xylostella]|uniref:NADP-dependent oxidoreductase domain-containing protein n=1 Tax=Plutella xylostella TaxID=51655 RepID=A0ABQ7PYL3_PLUXY|nr:hypothetical protein JYU34_018832 [Plutella xylostella]